ncbi:hypothetical protein QYE76_018545, partial [Lolium multiflorum]
MDRGKREKTDLVDFIPHPPSRLDACPIVMTFGEFRFGVNKEGSYRLEVPISSEFSAIDSDFSSSDEELSSPRFVDTKASGKLAKIFSDTSFESSADSVISSDSDSVDSFNFIDKSVAIGKVFTNLYDGVTNPDKNQYSKYHQVYAIEEASRAEPETSEAFDDLGNPYVDPADLRRGLGTKYVGSSPRERVQLPQAAWDRAARAMDGLKEDDEAKTAFITPYGVFCYRTMPFGLKNAGATYQRMMQKCLATQIGKNVQVYIDDVVITSKKGTTLIEDLKETFDNLDKFCLKLNPTKCSFGVPAGELLGFLVSARGIEANPEKIQAIVTMKETKLKEIQQLTGRVAALSRFVARLGEKALPFYALIKQGEKFQWNEEADRAFENLKRTISTPPILVAPKEKEPLLLYIAATPQVVSTALVVEREEEGKLHGVQRPVYFISEVLSPSKQRYPQYQKLAYGVFTTARKLRHYFSAHPIIVVNEAPLSNILNNPEATGRVSLWGIELSPRDITLSNDEADVLANIGSQCLAIPPGVFWEEISERSTKPMKPKKKEKDEKPSGVTKESLEEEERSISGVLQRCVTPEEGRIILKDVHEGICGHHASSRAIAAKVFRAGFYWLTTIEDAKEIVRTCDACQRFAAKPHSPAAELMPIPLSWPFAQWGLDMVGKLHKASPGGYEYMLVAVDKFTKWIEAKPINSPDGASAIKFVKSIVFRFGVPHSIVTDNDSNFTSKEFKTYCAEVGIKLSFASVHIHRPTVKSRKPM